jgi:hypothetical protein
VIGVVARDAAEDPSDRENDSSPEDEEGDAPESIAAVIAMSAFASLGI